MSKWRYSHAFLIYALERSVLVSFVPLSLKSRGIYFCASGSGGFIDCTAVLKNVEYKNVSPEPGIKLEFLDYLYRILIAIPN
jgi:hypothetical protein